MKLLKAPKCNKKSVVIRLHESSSFLNHLNAKISRLHFIIYRRNAFNSRSCFTRKGILRITARILENYFVVLCNIDFHLYLKTGLDVLRVGGKQTNVFRRLK